MAIIKMCIRDRDREYRAKEAGYRTHFLVSLGSALIMIVSQYGFMEVVKMEGIDSVSYTHLDVYKRQSWQLTVPLPTKRGINWR